MSENAEKSGMSAERRRRINRLKKIILTTVFSFIVIPIVICIVLGIRLHHLKGELNTLNRQLKWYEKALQEKTDSTDRLNALLEMNEIPAKGSKEGDIKAYQLEESFAPAVKEENETVDTTRKVYLTFDDGPSSQTNRILDICREYDIKVTFFVTGKTDQTSIDAYKRIVQEGHTLGMHSYSHKYGDIYASLGDFSEDLTKLQDYLYETTGVVSRLYRFPGGSSNTVSKTNIQDMITFLHSMDIEYYDWNVSSGDASSVYLSSEQIKNRVLSQIPGHQDAVVLMHDSADKKSTVDALPSIIEGILAMEDTEILPITEDSVKIQHVVAKE